MKHTSYFLPKKIVIADGEIYNEQSLLRKKTSQIGLNESDVATVNGKCRLVFDFGEEICGCVRILVHYANGIEPVRIRFGESLTEAITPLGVKNATNDHSARDFLADIPQLSDGRFGQTGFRYVCLEFSGGTYRIKKIVAESESDYPFVYGSFECSDSRVNDIYSVACKTLFLCLQNYMIWDGIKRDRLVWIGDLHPETLGLLYTTGDIENIENCLDFSVNGTPPTEWMNGLTSYSFWWIIILYDYYRFTGKREIIEKYADYLYKLVKNTEKLIGEDGSTAFPNDFLDWPTNDTKDAPEGVAALCKIACERAVELLKIAGKDATKAEQAAAKLSKRKHPELSFKQAEAMRYLAYKNNRETVGKALTAGSAKGMSTFMSYYILTAVTQTMGAKNALDMMKEYYGGMLDKGATTFWEDFDVDWIEDSGRIDEIPAAGKKDIHGDYGRYCYTGFRHSLCHGWSCGPIEFLVENILGVNVLETGFKKISVSPDLCGMEYAKGDIPTPYGTIKISHTATENGIKTQIVCPEEIEVIATNCDCNVKRVKIEKITI